MVFPPPISDSKVIQLPVTLPIVFPCSPSTDYSDEMLMVLQHFILVEWRSLWWKTPDLLTEVSTDAKPGESQYTKSPSTELAIFQCKHIIHGNTQTYTLRISLFTDKEIEAHINVTCNHTQL